MQAQTFGEFYSFTGWTYPAYGGGRRCLAHFTEHGKKVELPYVYDEAKFESSKKVLSINCPNCGAPVAGLDGGTCFYCGTYSKPINLKAWKMVSYKEEIN